MNTADENATDHHNVCTLFMNAVFCKESLRKNHASHTKMLIVFGMGRSTNFNYFLKVCQISKVHANSCKTKNVPSMKMNISDVAKIKNCHKQNFKDKANNMGLDEEANNMGLDEENIQRSNLKGKCFSCIKIS